MKSLRHVIRFTSLVVAILLLSGTALAAGGPPELGNPPRGNPPVSLPDSAIQVARGVFYLGSAVDKGRVVEGYAIVHYDRRFAKPGAECGNGICEPGENANKCPTDCGGTVPDTSSCYTFLAREAKWKTVEPYLVNPANQEGLNSSFLLNNLAADIQKWEDVAGVDILGAGSSTNALLVADTSSMDGQNEVYFGSIEEPGAIAITIIWGNFGGPPQSRELVEWDQVYDEVDFNWSATGEVGKMDFENIATHELGHSVGMGDLYTTDCSAETMYGYASYGETTKRDLNTGDITGIRALYQ